MTTDPSASTPATQLDLLSHVALACMQGLMASLSGPEQVHSFAVRAKEAGTTSNEFFSRLAFDLASDFLAERQKRLNPASSLNETGGAVSEGV